MKRRKRIVRYGAWKEILLYSKIGEQFYVCGHKARRAALAQARVYKRELVTRKTGDGPYGDDTILCIITR